MGGSWAGMSRPVPQCDGAAGALRLLAACKLSTPPPLLSCQAGDLCDQLGDTARAVEWFTRLLTKAPHDSGVLSRLGALHAK